MAILLLIIGLLLFVGLIVIHEFGHFIVARRNGVTVEEFGLGFPPKVWSRKTKGGFDFSINLLPLGGFVRLKGEHDADTGKGTFGAATTWVKTKIMAAGIAMNVLAAFVLLTILAWVGMPQLVSGQFAVKGDTKISNTEIIVAAVQNGSPAAHAGLMQRDDIVGGWTGSAVKSSQESCAYPVFGRGATQCSDHTSVPLTNTFASAQSFVNFTKNHAGESVALLVKRNGNLYKTNAVTLLTNKVVAASNKTSDPKGHIGVVPEAYSLSKSTWSAPVVALGTMKQFTVLTFQGLWTAIKGVGSIIAGFATHNKTARQVGQTQASSQVSGPVGIFVILKDGSALGYQFTLMIVAIISLSLAIMNILPIPALDGGKLFVTYVSRLFRKRVSASVEDWVYGTSFVFLLGLIALITVVDVKRFL